MTASKKLIYKLEVTGDAKRQCTTQTYRTSLPDGQPTSESSHFCGAPASPGDPLLIQSPQSRESMIIDVLASGCGRVKGGARRTVLRPLVRRCSAGPPKFRATILPPARRLVIVGISDVPVVNFARHICHTGICITPLV